MGDDTSSVLESMFDSGGVVDSLHQKLLQKDVDVRYGLVAYGGQFSSIDPIDPVFQDVGPNGALLGSEPRPVRLSSNPTNPYFASGPTAGEELKDAMTPKDAELSNPLESLVFNEGLTEDSWEAVDFIFKARFENDPANDLIYDFRENAAVHFVLITDDGRSRRIGEEPVLPAELPGQTNLDGVVNLATLIDQLDRQPNDRTDDIVLTAFIPVNFQPEDTTLSGAVLAVDMNVFANGVLSYWDVDLDQGTPSVGGPPDYLAFHAEDTTGDGNYDTLQQSHVEGDMIDDVEPPPPFSSYSDVKSELSCDPDCEYTRTASTIEFEFIFDTDIVDQEQIASQHSRRRTNEDRSCREGEPDQHSNVRRR